MEINIFDRYDNNAMRLIQSLGTAGVERKNLFVHYDGDLPKYAMNPFTYFTGLGQDCEPHDGLFFNKVKIPKFYAIRHVNGESANIEYLKNIVGKIYYRSDGYRLVDTVDWYSSENGTTVVKKDRYNILGQHFATTYFSNGTAYKTEYYNLFGEVVIVEDIVHRTVKLYRKKTVYHFENITDFFIYFLRVAKIEVSDIYINSLSFPLFISRKLDIGRKTTLFWQETLREDVPGNMENELKSPDTLRQIIFVKEKQLNKVEQMFPIKKVKLNYLSYIGEFVRDNYFRMNAFILTNSDNINGLREILLNFPKLNITVAAYTNMSNKLLYMEKEFNNLKLIPSINEDNLGIELGKADIYLDINYGLKVGNILERVYQQHMVIFSYKKVAKKGANSLVVNDIQDLCSNLSYIFNDKENWQKLLTEMIEKNGHLSNVRDYKEVLRIDNG